MFFTPRRIYRTPLVLGTSLVPVLSIAFFNATANALKALSALKVDKSSAFHNKLEEQVK